MVKSTLKGVLFMWTFLIISVVVIFILGIAFTYNDGKKAEENKQQLINNISNVEYTKSYITDDGLRALLVNDYSKDLYIYQDNDLKIINYKDILQTEIMENSKVITQTSRSSQVAGTILGSITLGAAGALIGGLSASQKHSNKVKTLGLRIVVNDTSNPVKEFLIKEFDYYVPTESKEYKEFYDIAFEWFKTTEVLINQADKDDENKESTAN